ncbi:hypothetical protein JOE23_001209 [Amphibacillus cookii]|nr:hypothetical protein [Amphibacillus cookii]
MNEKKQIETLITAYRFAFKYDISNTKISKNAKIKKTLNSTYK